MANSPENIHSKPVVLLVDDEPSVCSGIKNQLRKVEAEVLTAHSGKEGLATLAAKSVDVVICDADMPVMSGMDFLCQAAERFPATKRILLVDIAQLESTVSSITDGSVSSFLTKPWNDNHLQRVVEDAVASCQRARTMEAAANQQEEFRELNTKLEAQATQGAAELAESAQEIAHLSQELDRGREMLQKAFADVAQSYELTVSLLGNMIEMRDPEGADTELKCTLSVAIGEDLELDEEALVAIRHAMSLHRIGRMALSDEILRQSPANMSAQQLKKYHKHPLYGETLLTGAPNLHRAASIIRSQHEFHDGQGYPDGLAGDGIPLESGIISIARDYYDLLSGKLEGVKFTPADALEYIQEHSDRRHDGKIVKCFAKVLPTVINQDPFLSEICVGARMLLPGMKLARDLVTPDDVLMLNKKHELNETIIAKIINLEESMGEQLRIFVLKESVEGFEEVPQE